MCLTSKEFSGFGNLDSTRAALDQFQAKLLFEILDLATQGRLGGNLCVEGVPNT